MRDVRFRQYRTNSAIYAEANISSNSAVHCRGRAPLEKLKTETYIHIGYDGLF